MIPAETPEIAELVRILCAHSPRETISRTAGLLTDPNLQANMLRLETLVTLSVAHCAGKRKPNHTDIATWLNKHLGKTQLADYEDPVEDVFVTNIETPAGNRRIFAGLWESSDYFLQVALNTLMQRNTPEECTRMLDSPFALLKLSDCVAERLHLHRWHIETSTPKGSIPINRSTKTNERARAVSFTKEVSYSGKTGQVNKVWS